MLYIAKYKFQSDYFESGLFILEIFLRKRLLKGIFEIKISSVKGALHQRIQTFDQMTRSMDNQPSLCTNTNKCTHTMARNTYTLQSTTLLSIIKLHTNPPIPYPRINAVSILYMQLLFKRITAVLPRAPSQSPSPRSTHI